MKNFKLLPLSAAVMTALCAANAFAENQDVAVLDTVTVTDSQGLKVKSNVITTQKKDESVETDLRGLLKNEPSIGIGGGSGTSQFMFIRGMGQNSIDVKVDNAYSDSQIMYHQGRHMLDPALVKVVAVQKGAGSASAGIGQTNGAVIAKTLDANDLLKNSTNPNIGMKINGGYNTNDGYNYGVSAFGKNEHFDFVAAFNSVNEDDYKGGKNYKNGKDGSNRVPNSALDKRSYLVKLGANWNNHRFVLSHMEEQHRGERAIREEFLILEDNPRLTSARQTPVDRKMTVANTNLEWIAKDLGFAQEMTANVYRLTHGRWSADDSKNGYSGAGLNPKGPTKTEIETTGANINFDSAINDNLLLKYGVNYRNQEAKVHRIFDKFKAKGVGNQEKRDVGVYAETITSISNNVTLTTGLRYDHFSFKAMDGKKISDGAVNPSVGIIYEPIQYLSLSASHNYATRSPRMYDAQLAHGNRGIYSIASGTKAEKARNTEIGFNYNNGTWGIEGSYFWQHIKNGLGNSSARNNHIVCDTPAARCFYEIMNVGTIKNSGYEFAAFFDHQGLFGRIGVAYSKPQFYGQQFSANREYAVRAGRTWTGTLGYRFERPNLEIAVHHRQVESLKPSETFILANSVVTPSTEGRAGYGVTDLTANWKPFGNDKMNINFAVNNVGNKRYTPQWQGAVATTPPAVGREYRVGMNYTF